VKGIRTGLAIRTAHQIIPQRIRAAAQRELRVQTCSTARAVRQRGTLAERKDDVESRFAGLPRNHFHVVLVDPPWHFRTWSRNGRDRSADQHYQTMQLVDLAALPVADLVATDSVLLLWATWPLLPEALALIQAWGFKYKTCAFAWMKADPYRLFADDATPFAGLGYWTRANTEPCLLATRGKPKRLNADVRQGIIAPRREHSRKPDGIHDRIERLVAGPYLELFARQTRPGWTCWGNEPGKFTRYNIASGGAA
jgi:N6-adenosine-specific RNA methylase IME4